MQKVSVWKWKTLNRLIYRASVVPYRWGSRRGDRGITLIFAGKIGLSNG
jgi:hypothetical protein